MEKFAEAIRKAVKNPQTAEKIVQLASEPVKTVSVPVKEGQIRAFYLHAILTDDAKSKYPEWLFVYVANTDDVDGLILCYLAHKQFALIGRSDNIAVDTDGHYWIVMPANQFFLAPDELEKFSVYETDATLYSLDTPDVIPVETLLKLAKVKPDYDSRADLFLTVPPALKFRPLATD